MTWLGCAAGAAGGGGGCWSVDIEEVVRPEWVEQGVMKLNVLVCYVSIFTRFPLVADATAAVVVLLPATPLNPLTSFRYGAHAEEVMVLF